MATKLNVSKVLVLHVKKGYEARLESIKKQFGAMGIEFGLILDGDIPDINDHYLNTYFRGEIKEKVNAVTSCTLKHILAYEEIAKNGYKDCLIFEDDIFIKPNFIEVFNSAIDEINNRPDIDEKRVFISFENSRMKLIPASQRVSGQHLYTAESTRYAGAYYITNQVAKSIVDYTHKYKCEVVSDWYLTEHRKDFDMHIYWCHPPIAEQGSHSGKFDSSLNQKKAGILRRIAWSSQKMYKSITVHFK
jgi:glycosyl transferase family 25